MSKPEGNVKFERYYTKCGNGMKKVGVEWVSWRNAVIGNFKEVLIVLEISVYFLGIM